MVNSFQPWLELLFLIKCLLMYKIPLTQILMMVLQLQVTTTTMTMIKIRYILIFNQLNNLVSIDRLETHWINNLNFRWKFLFYYFIYSVNYELDYFLPWMFTCKEKSFCFIWKFFNINFRRLCTHSLWKFFNSVAYLHILLQFAQPPIKTLIVHAVEKNKLFNVNKKWVILISSILKLI